MWRRLLGLFDALRQERDLGIGYGLTGDALHEFVHKLDAAELAFADVVV